MRYIYFMRHGQTAWNVEHRICGISDIPLTEQGKEQAAQAAERIAASGIRIDEILYSPLQRAAVTAGYVAGAAGIPSRVEPRLVEQNFGRFEGTNKNYDDFKNARKEFAQHFGGSGESMLQLAQRIYNLLDELREDKEERVFLLVAHNGVGRMIHSYFHEMSNEEYAFHSAGNCELVRYEWPEAEPKSIS